MILLRPLRGIYTGNVGLAISLSDVISNPRSIYGIWYMVWYRWYIYPFQIYAKEIGNFLLKSHRSAKSLSHIACVNEPLRLIYIGNVFMAISPGDSDT